MARRNRFVRLSVAVVMLSVVSHQVAAQTLDDAIDLHDSGEFAAALDGFLVLAINGEADAQYYLGRMYHQGDGVLRDVSMAARWYRLAAERGHFHARLQLGHMFKTGEGVPQDGNEAAKWYRLAAEQGQAEAEKWIDFAIEPGVAETRPLPGIEPVLTRTTLAEQETELSRTQASLQEAHGREEELAQTLASERSELERLALLLQQSREAETKTGEALATREQELSDAGARIDQLVASLSSVRDRARELQFDLSTEQERTFLAQREVADRNRQIDELTYRLGIIESQRDLAVDLGGSQARQIAELRDRLASLNSALEAAEVRAAQDLVQITSPDAWIQELSDAGARIDQLVASLSSARDRTRELESELSSEQERTLLAQREVTDRNRQIDELTHRLGIVEGELDLAVELGGSQARQIADLRDRLASLNSALEAAEVRAAQDLVQITSLGERLNAALAERVQDLSRYRSDFLARLHDHLGNRQGVKVEGDRFIIQSGILFSSGSAEISGAGQENLREIANLIQELVSEIPDDVDWILRVDGHTDSIPIQTPQFPSNWELSTGRATSVVRFLISLGVPEHRLMAAGLGEFQPLVDGEDADTMQRNRRIEFKLTDR